MTLEDIKEKLTSKFGLTETSIRSPRVRRLFMDIDHSSFRQVLEYSFGDLQFKMLLAITGLDEGENLALIYHLANNEGIILSIKTLLPKSKPEVKTITDIFPGADIFEREIVDLLGFKVAGLTPGNRYPLTDDWPAGQYPLRKDFNVENVKGAGTSCQR